MPTKPLRVAQACEDILSASPQEGCANMPQRVALGSTTEAENTLGEGQSMALWDSRFRACVQGQQSALTGNQDFWVPGLLPPWLQLSVTLYNEDNILPTSWACSES